MNVIFHGEIVEYDFIDNKRDKTILFLHGWGGNKNSFIQTQNLLKNDFNIFSLTMPTIEPTNLSWNLFDYQNLILSILKIYNIENVIIICHSFGFRVACLLKDFVTIKAIVVTGGAGLKDNNFLKRISRNQNKILYNNKRFKFLHNDLMSRDYKSLPIINKISFKNIVNFNSKNLSKFDCPLLLFWGKNDKETKLKFAKYLYKKNRAKLIVTKGDHFTYLTDNALFNYDQTLHVLPSLHLQERSCRHR